MELCFVITEESNMKDLEALMKKLAQRHIVYTYIKETRLSSKSHALRECQSRGALFVCDRFSGSEFDLLKSLKCRIVGPPCVELYLDKKIPFPDIQRPVYSSAMAQVVACCTGIEREARDALYSKIELLGGEVHKALTNRVTHLIAENWSTEKSKMAAGLGIAVMTPAWVEHVWEASHTTPLHASEPAMMKHQLACFEACVICLTGLDIEDRKTIQELVETHGGVYSAELNPSCTHLIAKSPTGDKYAHALKWSIPTVSVGWLQACIDTGYLTDVAKFPVEEDIPVLDSNDLLVPIVIDTVEHTFLEDCRFYLDPLLPLEKSHFLLKIIRAGGGTKFAQLTEMVSFVICEQGPSVHELAKKASSFPAPPALVSPKWLLECFKQKAVVADDGYIVRPSAVPAPMGALPKRSSSLEDPRKREAVMGIQSEPISMKLEADLASAFADEWSTSVGKKELIPPPENVPEQSPSQSLKGLSFRIAQAFPKELSMKMKGEIKAHGGLIREPGVPADYFVDSLVRTAEDSGASERVTSLWLERSLLEQRTLSPSAWFFYVPWKTAIPLKCFENVVICLSGFDDVDRDSLNTVLTALGCQVSDNFLRRKVTHLVAASPSGAKFEKAQQWGIPAVSVEWISGSIQSLSLLPCGDYPPRTQTPIAISKPIEACTQPEKRKREDHSDGDDIGTLVNKNMRSTITRMCKQEPSEANKAILADVVAAFSRKIVEFQRREYEQLAITLGAKIRPALDAQCTHFFHVGKVSEAPKEAKNFPKVIVVSPRWLYSCEYSGSRSSEAAFPYCLNETAALITVPANSSPIKGKEGDTIKDVTAPKTEELKEKIDALINVSATSKARRRSSKPVRDNPRAVGRGKKPSRSNNSDGSDVDSIITGAKSEAGDEESPLMEVTYEDHNLREPPASRLHKKEIMSPITIRRKESQPKIFLLSSVDKVKYGKIIQDLGGRFENTMRYVPTCTHLIVGGEPSRSEKFLAACATGKWILRPDFLDDSIAKGSFVDEESYEISAPSGPSRASTITTSLASATRRWRLKVAEEGGRGAFSDWRVALAVEQNVREGFRSLLEAGGATIIYIEPPFEDLRQVNFAFIGKPSALINVAAMRAQGIACVKPEYIAEFIAQNPPPNPADFAL